MIGRRLVQGVATTTLGIMVWAGGVAAQELPPPVLVPQSPEFAAVRAQFEGMTEAQAREAGYVVEPVCVDAAEAGLPPALGGMGYHATHPRRWTDQFKTGRLDPNQPQLLLLDASKRVVGLEWEADAAIQPAPTLFGQTLTVQPGHPGPPDVNVPHYMLHAYFKPNGMVLFSVFDPELTCPAAAAPAAQPKPAASPQPAPAQPKPAAAPPQAPGQPKPAASPQPAPAQAPRALPRTGSALSTAMVAAPLAAAGGTLLLAGLLLRRRRD